MSTIDWSKAPDWASAHGKVFCITSRDIWFNESVYMYVGDTRSYPWANGETEVGYNHSRKSVTDIISRPIPWTGEGLPPVGTVCLLSGKTPTLDPIHPHWAGSEVKIYAHFKTDQGRDLAAYVSEDHMKGGVGVEKLFLPIRTAEQIAADERKAEIAALEDLIVNHWESLNVHDLAVTIYDSKYRKQEQS